MKRLSPVVLTILPDEEDVPGPASPVAVRGIVDLRAEAKLVAEFVYTPGFSIVQRDLLHSQFIEHVKFAGFGDAIVIGVLPQTQSGKHSIV